MSILMMLTVIFSIVYGVEFALKPDEETNAVSTDSIKNNFVTYLGLFYQFILGENPYEELSTTAWIVYLLQTLVVQVVALNLLIAILSETFANVYAQMEANHCRTMVEILIEISGLKCFYSKEPKELTYLHFVRYASEKISVTEKFEDQQTKIEQIQSKLSNLEGTVESMNEHILNMRDQQDMMLN